MVLKVWRSAWELEIPTKRLQDKKNNDLEEENETVHKQRDNNGQTRLQTKSF